METGKKAKKQYKIMIIDDDPSLLETLAEGLDSMGYYVMKAASAEDAMLMLTDKPDLILIDALLPKMNGFEFCKKVKESKAGKNLPVVIMTGIYKQHFQEKEAKLKYGASDYLVKPFTLESLENVIAVNLGLFDRGEITLEKLGFKASGSLKSVPIEKLLNNISETGKTGMLECTRGKVRRRLYFKKGFTVYATSNVRSDTVLAVLSAKGMLDEDQIKKVEQMSRRRKVPRERTLLIMQLVNEDQLRRALQDMIAGIIFKLLRWKEGEYTLKLKESPPPGVIPVQVQTKKVVIQSILKMARQ